MTLESIFYAKDEPELRVDSRIYNALIFIGKFVFFTRTSLFVHVIAYDPYHGLIQTCVSLES